MLANSVLELHIAIHSPLLSFPEIPSSRPECRSTRSLLPLSFSARTCASTLRSPQSLISSVNTLCLTPTPLLPISQFTIAPSKTPSSPPFRKFRGTCKSCNCLCHHLPSFDFLLYENQCFYTPGPRLSIHQINYSFKIQGSAINYSIYQAFRLDQLHTEGNLHGRD